jgi:hypothetical protein
MSEDCFSTDINNWNYYRMINKTGMDPYNNNKKLDPFSYNLMKFNTVILLKEILKNTKPTSDGYAIPEVVPEVEDAEKGWVSDRVAAVAFPRVSANAIDDPIVDV